MTQHTYKVLGHYFEKENDTNSKVDFVFFIPHCPSSYSAKLYVMDKLKEYQIFVQGVTRVID